MKSNEYTEFIEAYKQHFVEDGELKLTFRMGGNLKGRKRIAQVLKRFYEISTAVFGSQEVWVLLVIWDLAGTTMNNLVRSGFKKEPLKDCYQGSIDDGLIKKEKFAEEAFDSAKIFYLRYNEFSFNDVSPLVYSQAVYDLGIESSAAVTCYFTSFENSPVFLNLYDDRGMELLTHDEGLKDRIGKKFNAYVLCK